MQQYANWQLTIQDRVATLTLNRPEAMNSLTPDTFRELRDIAHFLRDQREIWAVILQGAGDHFSVGVDVNVIGGMVGQYGPLFRQSLSELQGCLNAFEALAKPTIAKIRGYCIGGGLLLSLCCDFRLASENASFSMPEVKRGIAVIMGTQRVTRIAGTAAAKEIILLGERFDAQTALRYNLLNQVLPDSELDSAAENLAAKFKQLPPRTIGVAKQIIDLGSDMNLRDSLEYEINAQAALLDSADFKEGVSSFFEKRPPNFTGM